MAAVGLTSPTPSLRIAMLSIHSSPMGPLGTRDTGGMSVYVRELASWLGAAGHDVDIYTYVSDRRPEVELHPGVRLIHLNNDKPENIGKEQLPQHLQEVFAALEQYRQTEGQTYDLIHSHYWLSGMVGAMAQAQWQCPHLTMFHTLGLLKNQTASAENEPGSRIARERQLVQAVDHIVVPAATERENLLRNYDAPPEKISVIPCGVNLEQFHPMDQTAARKAIGLKVDMPVALFVGRFAPLKGIDLLLAAAAQLKDAFPDLHLVIAGGDGSAAASTAAVEAQADALGLRANITMTGRVDHGDLKTYYNAADLVVIPSHYESFGLVVLEALACGTPVAATPFGAAQAVIQDGRNGAIIAKPTVEAIVQAMRRQLTRPARETLSPAQIRDTVAEFSWRSIAAKVAALYNQLIENNQTVSQTKVSA